MSEENVELARRAVDMLNQRDLDGLLALMAKDVESEPRLAPMEGGNYDGHDGIRRWWKNVFDAIPDLTAEVLEVRDYGDDLVLAIVHSRGHGAESAAPFDQMSWQPARIRQGKCVWWGNYLTDVEALETAGLRE